MRASSLTLLRELRVLLAGATGDARSAHAGMERRPSTMRAGSFGVAVTNAEATMQRLITEDSPNPRSVEAAMTVLDVRPPHGIDALGDRGGARAAMPLGRRAFDSSALIARARLRYRLRSTVRLSPTLAADETPRSRGTARSAGDAPRLAASCADRALARSARRACACRRALLAA